MTDSNKNNGSNETMSAPFKSMQMSQTLDNSSESSISLVTETEHQQTVKHGSLHKYSSIFLVMVIFVSIIGYGIYGVLKIQQSKENPAVTTTIKTVTSYPTPLVYVCPELNALGVGTIHPFRILEQTTAGDETGDNFICTPGENGYLAKNDLIDSRVVFESTSLRGSWKYRCEDLMTTPFSEQNSWRIVSFSVGMNNYDINESSPFCYALIPPHGHNMSHSLMWAFVWEPTDDYKTYFQNTIDINYISLHRSSFGMYYNVIHPDLIDTWYQDLQNNDFVVSALYTGFYTTSPDYGVNIFAYTGATMSLYSREHISGFRYQHYQTIPEREIMDVGTGMSAMYYTNWENVNIPKFIIDVTTQKWIVDGTSKGLFLSETIEKVQYGWLDLFGALGGFVGGVMGICAKISAVVLVGIGFGIAGCKWNGIAPYPPFEGKYQVRLRRFINKETKHLDVHVQ